MTCSACNTTNPEGAQFCSNCGASLGAYPTGGDWARYDQPQQKVGFTNAISLGFNRYIKFSGRSTRAEYWWWVLFLVLADLLLSIVDIMMGTYDASSNNGLISGLFSLVTLIPSLSLGVRRLHDINRTGWWQLMWVGIIFLIPLLVLLWWAIKPSNDGTNKYGPDPRRSTHERDSSLL